MKPLPAVLLAEFIGTVILIVLGDGVVGSAVLLGKGNDWVIITTGWGLAVAIAVYISGRLSGGHLNPAVTLALAMRRDFPWNRVLPYWAAQIGGAFAGAAIVYLDYFEAFQQFEMTNHLVRGVMLNANLPDPAAGGAGVFANYPRFNNLGLNFFSEFLATAVLVMAVFALIDPENSPPGANLTPLLVGFVVWSIGLSLGGLTGYAINPARDFGPRLASSVLGWGTSVFESHDYYFWIPIAGPLVGGVAGAYLYDLCIRQFLLRKEPVKL